MTTRRPTSCALCDNVDLASLCPACVNHRLNEYNVGLRALKSRRDALYVRLSEVLIAKIMQEQLMILPSRAAIERKAPLVPFELDPQHVLDTLKSLSAGKIDDQYNWRVAQTEKLSRLKEKLRCNKEQLVQGKAKVDKLSKELKAKYGVLEAALRLLDRARVEQLEKFYPNLICTQTLGLMAITSEHLHKQSVVMKQLCKLFPQRRVNVDGEKKEGPSGQFDQICNARLPRGLDPHSVPSEELGASLGYMVQLLNLVVRNLGVPSLHSTGFAGSCSRIWQRDSYWDTRPSSRSNEYPLFIPRQNYCSANGENSWSDRSFSNFGVASMESERKPQLDSCRSSSFNYASASQHSVETHKDLQRGISLLKKSVACITAYCYNSLCLDVPSEASTFEAFSRLLGILSSSKEVRSAFSLKMACSRSSKQVLQMNKSVWNVNSAIASSTLLESAIMLPIMKSVSDPNLHNSTASFLYATDLSDNGKSDTLIDGGWDLVERPTFPPPPSQNEDVKHWTRAMFIDATKK